MIDSIAKETTHAITQTAVYARREICVGRRYHRVEKDKLVNSIVEENVWKEFGIVMVGVVLLMVSNVDHVK